MHYDLESLTLKERATVSPPRTPITRLGSAGHYIRIERPRELMPAGYMQMK
jgi:hypothetical protein